ncbi:hypothetical protein AOLI_G00116490 [Acnodon oligacanthus]
MYGNHAGVSLPDGIFHTRVRQEVDGADKAPVEVYLLYADVITKAVETVAHLRNIVQVTAIQLKLARVQLRQIPCFQRLQAERREGRHGLQLQIYLCPSVGPGPTSTSRSGRTLSSSSPMASDGLPASEQIAKSSLVQPQELITALP